MRRYVHRCICLFSSVKMRLCMHKKHTLWKRKRGCLWITARSFTCGLIFFTSQRFASASELLPSMIGLSAFLPGHYDLIHKLDRNQVCSSSPNQSAIPFLWLYIQLFCFFSFECLWTSYYYSYFSLALLTQTQDFLFLRLYFFILLDIQLPHFPSKQHNLDILTLETSIKLIN